MAHSVATAEPEVERPLTPAEARAYRAGYVHAYADGYADGHARGSSEGFRAGMEHLRAPGAARCAHDLPEAMGCVPCGR